MAQTIHCFEPQGRPKRVSISVEPGEPFSVYLLQDTMADATRGLRDTVMRRDDQAPPHQAMLLFEAELRPTREGEQPTMRVRRIGPNLTIDQLRPDLRSRLTKSSTFKTGTRFEATLSNLRTISFSLEVAAQIAQGARASGAAGRRRKAAAVAGAMSVFWIIPSVVTTMADPLARVKTMIFSAAKRAGLSPALISPMLLMSGVALGLGYVAYSQYEDAKDAEERAAQAEDAKVAAEAGRDAALVAEAACVAERKELSAKLDDVETKRLLAAEEALAVPTSRSVAVELGGAVMASDEVLSFDQLFAETSRKAVVQEMTKLRDPPENAGRCLAMEQVLGSDLPRYVLLWHPNPDLVCPTDYAVVEEGVARAGSWGISTRASKEFGAPEGARSDGEAITTDPRMNDRWSSATLATGVRSIVQAVLTSDTAGRPPVPPGQVHLWALALWDAYNRMPSPADGVMNEPAEACVQEFIMQVAAASNPSDPGEPVLPDLTLVVMGEPLLATPKAGCPWPADAINKGAKSAFRAVGHLANIKAAESEAVANGG